MDLDRHLDHPQNLIDCSGVKWACSSVHYFLVILLTERQINQQEQKHNLSGSGKHTLIYEQ